MKLHCFTCCLDFVPAAAQVRYSSKYNYYFAHCPKCDGKCESKLQRTGLSRRTKENIAAVFVIAVMVAAGLAYALNLWGSLP